MSEPPKPSPETKQKKQNFTSFCIGLYLGSLTTALMIFDDKRMHPKRPAAAFPTLLPTKKNLKLSALIPFFWSAGIVLGLMSARQKQIPRGQKDPILMDRRNREQGEAWRRVREEGRK